MALVAAGRAHRTGHVVARAQFAAPDLGRRDVDVLTRLPVWLGADETAPVRQHVEDSAAHVLLALLARGCVVLAGCVVVAGLLVRVVNLVRVSSGILISVVLDLGLRDRRSVL